MKNKIYVKTVLIEIGLLVLWYLMTNGFHMASVFIRDLLDNIYANSGGIGRFLDYLMPVFWGVRFVICTSVFSFLGFLPGTICKKIFGDSLDTPFNVIAIIYIVLFVISSIYQLITGASYWMWLVYDLFFAVSSVIGLI